MDFSGAVDLGNKKNTSVVEETNIGIYVWEMSDGSWVADEDGNFMLIRGRRGDVMLIGKITDAARSYGITEGRPVFLAGHRPVSEEEYQEQRARLHMGLVPDTKDYHSQLDDLKNAELR